MENIEIYYESIKQVYNQILEWVKGRESQPEPIKQKIANIFIGIFLVLLIASLIPIVPTLFVFIGSRYSWSVFNYQLNQATIWTYIIAWLISSVTTLLLTVISFWLDSKVNSPKNRENLEPLQTLSAEQLTFIFTYQAYKELKIFFVSHINQHIDKAIDSLNKLQRDSIITNMDFGIDEIRKNNHAQIGMLDIDRRMYSAGGYYHFNDYSEETISLSTQISIASEFLKTFEKYSWFHIDDLTKARLQALISFQKKIMIRLKKREDLPAVLNVLKNLSRFTYAFLPEHQTNMPSDELNLLQSEGIRCLDEFVEDVNKLIDYPEKQRQDAIEHSIEKSTIFKRIQILYLSNVFFRFIVWLLLLLAITTGLVFIAGSKFKGLDINIMISTVIASSITGATALAVIGGKHNKTIQELKNKSRQQLIDISENNQDEDE